MARCWCCVCARVLPQRCGLLLLRRHRRQRQLPIHSPPGYPPPPPPPTMSTSHTQPAWIVPVEALLDADDASDVSSWSFLSPLRPAPRLLPLRAQARMTNPLPFDTSPATSSKSRICPPAGSSRTRPRGVLDGRSRQAFQVGVGGWMIVVGLDGTVVGVMRSESGQKKNYVSISITYEDKRQAQE
jgi:hypothetical protein